MLKNESERKIFFRSDLLFQLGKMKKTKANFLSLVAVVFLGILIFTVGGCGKQDVSKAESVTNSSTVTSTGDADIDAAQKVIEKAPDAANGYNILAIIYIRRARETGDFSLNSKAQTAIDRALELEPDNSGTKKLQASLLLTFHRFQEALEAGTQ